jgi:hypothetical protein
MSGYCSHPIKVLRNGIKRDILFKDLIFKDVTQV